MVIEGTKFRRNDPGNPLIAKRKIALEPAFAIFVAILPGTGARGCSRCGRCAALSQVGRVSTERQRSGLHAAPACRKQFRRDGTVRSGPGVPDDIRPFSRVGWECICEVPPPGGISRSRSRDTSRKGWGEGYIRRRMCDGPDPATRSRLLRKIRTPGQGGLTLRGSPTGRP